MNEKESKSKVGRGRLLKRLVKYASIALAFVVVLIGALVLVAKYAISDRTWLAMISTAMEDNAGYTMEVKGEVSFDLSLHTTFEASDVVISNRTWKPEPLLGKFDQLAIGLDLLPLLSYQLIIDVIIKDSDIVLEYNEQGKSNWKLDEPSILEEFEIETNQLNISDTKITYRDQAKDLGFIAELNSLEFEPQNKIYSSQLKLTGSYRDSDYLVDGNLRVDPIKNSGVVSLKAGLQARGRPIDLQDPDIPMLVTVEGPVARDESGWRFNLGTQAHIREPSAIISLVPQVPEAAALLFPLQASARLTLLDDKLDVTKLVASVENTVLSFRADGDLMNVTDVPQIKLGFNGRFEDVSKLPAYEEFDPASLPALGPLQVSASLSGSGKNLKFDNVDISLDQPGLKAAAKGDIEFSNGSMLSDIGISAKIDDLSELPVTGGLPALGPVSLKAKLSSSGEGLDVTDIDVKLEQPGLNLDMHGAIRSIDTEPAVDLEFEGEVDELSSLPPVGDFNPTKLPIDGALALKGRLSSIGGGMGLVITKSSFTRPGMQFAASGTVSNLLTAPEANLDLSGKVAQISTLPPVGGVDPSDLPLDGELRIKTSLSGSMSALKLTGVDINLNSEELEASASGAMSYQRGGDPVADINFRVRGDAVSSLPDLGFIDRKKVHADGPFAASGQLIGSGNHWDLKDMWVTYHQPGPDGFITLTGNVDDFMAKELDIDLTLQARASSLNQYSSLLGFDLPDRGAVEIRGRLTGKEGEYRLAIIDAYMGINDFSGSVVFNVAGKIPRIKASLRSRQTDLGSVLYKKETESEGKGVEIGTESEPRESELATATPINLEWMNMLNAELDLSIDHLIVNKHNFHQNGVSLVLKGGNMKVSRGGGTLGGGTGEWNLEIAHDQTPTRYYFNLDFDNIEFADLLALPPGVIRKGEASGTVLMVSEGDTLDDLLAKLNGGILLSMGPAGIYDAGISRVSGNLLSGILRGVSITDEEGFTGYQCGIFGVVFRDGIATINKSITLQSKGFNITAKGTIDLPSRTIDIHMRPRAKQGLGYSVSSLIGGFRIKGDLASPKLKLNAGEITLSLLLGLLRGPIDRINSGKYSCDNVLEKIATGLEEIDRKDKIHSGVWRGLRDEIDK